MAKQNARRNNAEGLKYRVQTLQVKVFRSLLINREKKCKDRYMEELALRTRYVSLANKGIRTLLWYLI